MTAGGPNIWAMEQVQAQVQHLSPNMQNSFLRLMDEMYDQESDSMLRFIEESRRQLRMLNGDFSSEQEALRLTGEHLSGGSRMSGASSKQSFTSSLPPINGSTGNVSPCSSSLDSVTFESEQHYTSRTGRSARNTLKHKSPSGSSLSVMFKQTNQVSPMPSPRHNQHATQVQIESTPGRCGQTGNRSAVSTRSTSQGSFSDEAGYDSTKEYEEERDKIMKNMSGAHMTLERERTRQRLKVLEHKEKKKEKKTVLANQLVREASALEEMKEKDKRRQEEIVRQKLDLKKRQREKTELSLSVGFLTQRPASDNAIKKEHLGYMTSRPGTAATCMVSVENPNHSFNFDPKNPMRALNRNTPSREKVPEAWGDAGGNEDKQPEVGEGGESERNKKEKKKEKKKKKNEKESEEDDFVAHEGDGEKKKKKKKKKKEQETEKDGADEEAHEESKKKKKKKKEKAVREDATLDII